MKLKIAASALFVLIFSFIGSVRADITNGLVLYLPLNETSGTTAFDSSGLGNNGTLTGFSGDDSYWTNGWINGGLKFGLLASGAATTNYISIPNTPSLNFNTTNAVNTTSNLFTLAAWVKVPTAQTAGAAILAKGTGGNEQYDLDINPATANTPSTDRFRLVARNSANVAGFNFSSTVVVPNNVWTHVVVTVNASSPTSQTARMYINGVSNNTQTVTTMGSLKVGSNPPSVGARQSAAAAYNFAITNSTVDEVRIYNRVLSPSDIFELYSFGGLGNTNGSLTITTPPRNVTNYVGDVAAFAVTAAGTTPFFYQWFSNSVAIANQTNSSLVLTNVQLSWSAAYSVQVTNIIGSTNIGAFLQVQSLPVANITDNLVGYWKFDESSGSSTAADSSGNGNPGTLTGFADLSSVWVTGITNNALNFNADASALNLVAVPSVGSPGPAVLDFSANPAFTLSAWVNAPSSVTQSNGAAIICRGTGNGGEQYTLDVPTAGYRFYVRNGSNTSISVTTTIKPNGTWQNVVAVFDAINGIQNIYVNGQLVNITVAPTSLNPTNATAHEVTIGNRQSSAISAYNLPFTGAIDDVRIYSRALTSADVQALYATGGTYPPSFALQPTGGSLYVGDNLKLSTIVGGTVPIGLQWQLNGTNIPGATNATFLLSNVQLTNAGTYKLVAANGYGTTNSDNAVVQVSTFLFTNALAGYWKFDETTGLVAVDSSGNANGASLQNFSGDDSQWVAGRFNGAIQFQIPPSTNQYADIPDSPTLNFNSNLTFTISAWVKGRSTQISGAAIVAKGTGGGGEQFDLDVTTGYRFLVRTAGNTAAPGVTTTVLPNGLWQHVVGTFDGNFGVMKLFVNGQLIGTNAAPNSLLINNHDVTIGARQGAAANYNLNFVGAIDDVRIYNRALSDSQVQGLYLDQTFAPSFLTQPVGAVKWAGDNVAFSATADGTIPLSYQWQTNNVNIFGATNTTLLLTNLQISDAGTYTLVAMNSYGTNFSLGAVLQVNTFSITNTVGYWKFDETSGQTAADSSVYGNPGALAGFPFDDSQWVVGRINNGLNFDANGSGSSVVTIPDNAAFNFTNSLLFSVAAWVRGSSSQINGAGIVAKGTGAGGEQFALDAHIDQVATPGYRLIVRNSAGTSTVLTTPVALSGHWQHVVAVWDGTTGSMQIYVNGQLVATGAGPTSLLSNTHELSIGNRQSGALTSYNLPFVGIIDDVRLYNRALKTNEVQDIYSAAGILPPTIYSQPASVSAYIGDSATFTVSADASAPLTYQWLKNGTNLTGATGTSLTFSSVQFSDAATYAVQVSNGPQTVTSSNATLQVLAVPTPDITTNLIAYWTFDETTGTAVADSSGNGNSVTLFNFAGDDSQWAPGRIGGALHMNANGVVSNQFGATDNPLSLQNGNQFSFSFWAKLDSGPHGINPRFITPSSQHWVLWTPGRGVGFLTPTNSTEPSSNVWTHYVVVFDRLTGSYTLYVNGAREAANVGPYSKTNPTGFTWAIGYSETSTTSDSWTGFLDDMRVYNRLLNINDARALYYSAGGQPALSITRNGSSITITWSAAAIGFQLQSTDTLGASAVWSNAGTPSASADGLTQTITTNADTNAKFYRLQK